jgi:hypothetical protein
MNMRLATFIALLAVGKRRLAEMFVNSNNVTTVRSDRCFNTRLLLKQTSTALAEVEKLPMASILGTSLNSEPEEVLTQLLPTAMLGA